MLSRDPGEQIVHAEPREAKQRGEKRKTKQNKTISRHLASLMILDALPRLAASTRVVLASASPRRAELLRQLGITKFEVRPSSFAEDLPKTTDGATYARATAWAKAKEVAALVVEEEAEASDDPRNVLVIAADTVVEVDSLILEKPSETDGGLEGTEMLRRLSGRKHSVSTGVALVLVRKAGRGEEESATSSKSFSETTVVRFADLPDSEIDAYVASGENLGKAGGYGIQGPAGAFVEGIQGCYFNVVGLPLHSLAREVAALMVDVE